MKKRLLWVCISLLFILFSAFGVAVYQKTLTVDAEKQGFVSVAGLDGDVYLRRYSNIYSIFRIKKRHPGEVIAAAPWYVVGTMVAAKAGEKPAKIAMVILSGALAAATVWLLWAVVGDLGAVVLWISFAYVWLLAAAPELFAVSQAVLLGVLMMVKREIRDIRAWAGVSLFAGAVTITNVVKPVLAFGAFVGPQQIFKQTSVRRYGRQIVWGVLGLLLAGVLLEIGKWFLIDRLTPMQEIASGWDYIAKWASTGYGLGERLARTWEMFICEPIMTHGAFFGCANEVGLDELALGYGSAIPHLTVGLIVILCAGGAWRARSDRLVRAALAMVSFDFLLHVVIGWGLVEAQIYCGHWLFVVPVLISRLKGTLWKLALAAVVLAWNLQFLSGLVR